LIKIEMPPPGPQRVFQLSTPRHMFMKLHWELDGLREILKPQREDLSGHITAAYFAFNFAVSAWHLSDWTWESFEGDGQTEVAAKLGLDFSSAKNERQKLELYQDKLRELCPALAICWDIANGSKHMTDRQKSDVKVGMDWSVRDARADEPFLSNYTYELYVKTAGKKQNAVEVFEDVYSFWRRFLEDWGFLEARFIQGDPPTRSL
jgi:hypothetical protein